MMSKTAASNPDTAVLPLYGFLSLFGSDLSVEGLQGVHLPIARLLHV